MYQIPKQTFTIIDFLWYMCRSMSPAVFAVSLIQFVSVNAQPSTDISESRVGTHMQREHTLAEEISEMEGELGQEVTRVSSIATGMERCPSL